MNKFMDFLYKIFFDREDALDILQVLFTVIVVITLLVVWNLSAAVEESATVKIEALVTLRWLVGLLVITAVPKWMIPSLVKILTKGSLPSTPPKTETYDDTPTEDPS